MTFTIKALARNERLTASDRALALKASQPLLSWGREAMQRGNFLNLTDGQVAMLADGHAAYEGAKLVLDLFTSDPRTKDADRTLSYAIYSDLILCIEGLLQTDLSKTPAREVSATEIKELYNKVISGKHV